MGATDWAAIVGAIGGVIGAASGVIGVRIAALARRDARKSARAASRSADEASAATRLGLEKRHADLRPEAPAEIVGEVRSGALFGTIVVRHDYRIHAVAVLDERSFQPVAMPLLIRANQPQSFQIELWPDGAEAPKTREIHFRFWPPIDGADRAEPWYCRCGMPTGEDTDGPGHWEWTVPVTFEPPNEPFAMYT